MSFHFIVLFKKLIGKKIKNISQLVAFSGEKFSVLALRTGYSCKFPVLDIEQFCKKTSCCSCFSGIEMFIAALGTGIF
jgi:hypothetical protein